MKARLIIATAALSLTLAGTAGAAEDPGIENQLRNQLRSTVTQLRELQDQQATLQAQKTAAEQERDALKKKAGGGGAPSAKAVAAAAALKRSLAGARQDAEAARQAASQTQAELALAKQQLEQAQAALRSLQAQDEELKATLASTSSTLEACKVKNVELISVGNEVLDRFKKVGVSGAVLAREPFTGLHRIKLQNLAQGYEDRLYAGRYDPKRDKAPPPPTPAANVTEPSSH